MKSVECSFAETAPSGAAGGPVGAGHGRGADPEITDVGWRSTQRSRKPQVEEQLVRLETLRTSTSHQRNLVEQRSRFQAS